MRAVVIWGWCAWSSPADHCKLLFNLSPQNMIIQSHTLLHASLPSLPSSPVLAASLLCIPGEVQSPDLCVHHCRDAPLWDAPQTSKHGQDLHSSQPVQQSIKLRTITYALLDLHRGGEGMGGDRREGRRGKRGAAYRKLNYTSTVSISCYSECSHTRIIAFEGQDSHNTHTDVAIHTLMSQYTH